MTATEETTTVITIRHNGGSRQDIDLEDVLRRWLEDTLQQALPGYWERRAYELQNWVRTDWGDRAAEACRNHAALLRGDI